MIKRCNPRQSHAFPMCPYIGVDYNFSFHDKDEIHAGFAPGYVIGALEYLFSESTAILASPGELSP